MREKTQIINTEHYQFYKWANGKWQCVHDGRLPWADIEDTSVEALSELADHAWLLNERYRDLEIEHFVTRPHPNGVPEWGK